MIYLSLFCSFFIIGAISFGGGYAMISIILDTVVAKAWLTEAETMNFIAISESTPGPLAINMATFVGSSQAGFLGALAATFGVILPSFIIILLIASLLKNLLKYKIVQSLLRGVRPSIVALIILTAINMAKSLFFIPSSLSFDYRKILIFIAIVSLSQIYKTIRKKTLPPIAVIVISALLGLLFFIS